MLLIDLHFAHEICEFPIAGNQTVLTRLKLTQIRSRINASKMHGAAASLDEGMSINRLEKFRMQPGSGGPFRLLKPKILNNVNIITQAQTMNTLPVRAPRIMVVALFRINARCTEHPPGEGYEEDINAREF
jgi:hypothetical protein